MMLCIQLHSKQQASNIVKAVTKQHCTSKTKEQHCKQQLATLWGMQEYDLVFGKFCRKKAVRYFIELGLFLFSSNWEQIFKE